MEWDKEKGKNDEICFFKLKLFENEIADKENTSDKIDYKI